MTNTQAGKGKPLETLQVVRIKMVMSAMRKRPKGNQRLDACTTVGRRCGINAKGVRGRELGFCAGSAWNFGMG